MPKKLTKEQFIERSNKIHNNFYLYDNFEYKNAKTKSIIICPKHGEFLTSPDPHMRGVKCPKCAIENISSKLSFEEFIIKANIIHENKFIYINLSKIKSTENKIEIICPEHGSFWQSIIQHLRGVGCKKCANKNLHLNRKSSISDFIEKANQVHDFKYDYSKINYINSQTKIEIICNEHGSFWQKPSHHIHSRNGCPKCNISKGEEKIKQWLDQHNITYIQQYRFKNCKNKRSLPFDFAVLNNDKLLALIEYDGEQHFRPAFPKNNKQKALALHNNIKARDQIKNQYCEDNNIKLLRIPYFKFKNIPEILSSLLLNR